MENFNEIQKKIQEDLSLSIVKTKKLTAGKNNILFKITCKLQKNYILKFYNKDKRMRLEREYGVLCYLHSNGFTNIPKALWEDRENNCALYSFETGSHKKAADINRNDIDKIVEFYLALSSIERNEFSVDLPPTKYSITKISGYFESIASRVEEFLESESIPQIKHIISHQNPHKKLLEESNKLKSDIPKKILQETSELILSPIDVGIHNMLFEKNKATFLDFEYCEWDSQYRLIAEFINHATSLDIDQSLKDYLIQQIVIRTEMTPCQQAKLKFRIRASELEWMGIVLSSLSPRILQIRQKAIENFDLTKYIEKQMIQFNQRMATWGITSVR